MGETRKEYQVKYRPDAIHRVPSGDHVGECFPDDYSGQVTAVKPVGTWGEGIQAPFAVVRMSLTDDERMGLSGRTLKIVGSPASPEPAPVVFEDKWGAVTADIPIAFRNAMDEEAQLQASIDEKDQETLAERKDLYDAVRGYIEHLRLQLPVPDIHTGTGLYNAKAVPAHNDDTQSGAPAGQVITLTVGGLGITGWEGGYVVNTNAAETRAIVSHTNMTVTLEGNLANWLNGHDLDIYDAWATVQGTADQLFVDQAGVNFAAEQYISIYDGTYDENIALNAGLRPVALYPLFIGAASGEMAVILTNASQGANSDTLDQASVDNIYVSDMEIRNVKGTGYALGVGLSNGCWVKGCLFEGSATASTGIYSTTSLLVEDCTFQGFTTFPTYECSNSCFRRCRFHGGTLAYAIYTSVIAFESCVFDGVDEVVFYATNTKPCPLTGAVFKQCTFYNCTDVFKVDASNAFHLLGIVVRDCVFHTITNYVFDAGIAKGLIDSDYNCFFNCGKIARFEGADYNNLAAWQAYTDIDGNSPDANSKETDPLLTNPGADDFTLQATSPCKWAGMGSGVKKDIAGVDFDPYSPDQGVHSSGLHIKVVQPRW